MPDTRTDPPSIAPEKVMLLAWLELQRETLAMKCAGLDDEALRRRSVPPSTLSLLGLVRHMAEVERVWFRDCIGRQESPAHYGSEAEPDADFDDVDEADVAEAFATWQLECAHAREVTAAHGLDDTGVRRGRERSLRWVLVHMVEEYARHNGHADLLRQTIDGAVGY